MRAYSQLTHEQLIDFTWDDSILPLLQARYPNATHAELNVAHAYAYGGCLIQDIGYYPFGKRFFSDLAHYVRSGDFVEAMLRNAANVNEFAFAIGALSHYVGDSIGHSQAVNPSTAIIFHDDEVRYGRIVTYEEAPYDHVRTEFGFDVAQSAWRRYAPKSYRKAIRFRVARVLLYRSFQEIYGLRTRGILGPVGSAVASYHWSVTALIPAFVRAQIVRLQSKLPPEKQDLAEAVFLHTVGQSDYARHWSGPRGKPGVRSHLLAWLIAIVPKVGFLKVTDIKSPTEQTEDLFVRSVDHALSLFRAYLVRLRTEDSSKLALRNVDLDTGKDSAAGESGLVDATHGALAIELVREKADVPQQLRDLLLTYYAGVNLSKTIKGVNQVQRLRRALEVLTEAE